MVLKQEQPAAIRDFPVEGCNPLEYQRAAIKVLAWQFAVFTVPCCSHATAAYWPGLAFAAVLHQPTLLVPHLMPCHQSCMDLAESCRPLWRL